MFNKATKAMVIDAKLKEKALELHNHFQHMLESSADQPDLTKLKELGFQSVGKAQNIEGLTLNMELAKKYEALCAAYPGYMIIHEKHLLAWLLVNDLFIGDHYQFTGLIPEKNENDIHEFIRNLRFQDCVLQYKEGGAWRTFDANILKDVLPRITAYKGTKLHTVEGERIKFGTQRNPGPWTAAGYLNEANVRALPGFKMVADIKFFDRSAYLTDAAKNAEFFRPNPDPLVVLPIGEFNVIVTAWGHEEKLLPGLDEIAKNNPVS